MKKKILIIIIILILVTAVYAADVKWSALAENTTVADNDVLCIIDTGGGVSQKITVLNFFDTIDTFAELNIIVADETLVSEEGTPTLDALWTFDLGLTITTGDPFTLGANRIDNGADLLDGEMIGADTIDNDSIDWGDMTDLDTDGTVIWGNIAAGELTDDSVNDDDINWGDIANLGAGGAVTLSATVTVSDDEATNDDQEIVFTTDNTNLESDGDFHYSPDTGTVTATEFVGGGAGITGLSVLYNNIGDPGAAGSISFGDTETATYTTVQDTAGSFISFINSNADVSNQVYMLDLDYSADTTQDNADFIRLQDAGSTLVVFEEEGKITMTPSGVDDATIISIIPSVALTQADAFWCGIQIDGDALDPGDVDNTVLGIDVDLSGVDLTNIPYVEALELIMPTGGVALHIEEGKIKQEFTSGSDAGAEYTAIDMFMDASSQAATSETHAIDVAVVGGDPAGLVVGLGTHTYVAPVHQHIGVFSTPDQAGADSEAGFFDDSGTDYIDGVDGIEQFTADDDAIWISAAAVFTEIEVIFSGIGGDDPATRSITPTFWYWKDLGIDAWTQFFPADDTDGFQQSGTIRWETAAVPSWLSADVVNLSAGDPGEAAAGYWIAIIRTVNADPGAPTPTTVKTGAITEFSWDETGAIDVLSMEADTITEGGVAVYNDNEMDELSEIISILTDVTAFITDDDMPAVGADPDVDAAGEIGRDSDGADETGDSSLRGYDGANQFLYSKKLKTISFTLISPDTIDAADLIPVWHNTSGMTFTIVEWKAWSDDDDVSLEIEELTDQTDYTAITTVDAVEIATNGTGVFYASDSTITHAAIEHDHSIAIDFDTSDTPDYVQISITGWFNSDVN